jgi:hypothetical protein
MIKLEFGTMIFMEGRKPEKNPWSKGENQQQTQLAYDTGSRNQTRATMVKGQRSHCYATHASQGMLFDKFCIDILVPSKVWRIWRRKRKESFKGKIDSTKVSLYPLKFTLNKFDFYYRCQ